MALQRSAYSRHKSNPPLQSNAVPLQSEQEPEAEEEKKVEGEEEEVISSLPLRIFGDGAARFMCNQCHNVPLKVATCDSAHVFCQSCLLQIMSQSRICPVDKTQIAKPNLETAILDMMISQEKVRCVYSSEVATAAAEESELSEGAGGYVTKKGDGLDCPWTGTVSDILAHLKSCPFKPLQCPFKSIGCRHGMLDDHDTNDDHDDDQKEENSERAEQLSQHYSQYHVQHQNLLLEQIQTINDAVSRMQQQMDDIQQMLSSAPGASMMHPGSVPGSVENEQSMSQQLQALRAMVMKLQHGGKGGEGGGEERKTPPPPEDPGVEIVDTARNVLFAVGCNEKGDLGVGDSKGDKLAAFEELEWSRGRHITQIIACSYKAFAFMTNTQEVYVSGCNEYGQLGLNSEDDQYTAKLHPFFSGQNMKILAVSRSINAFHVFFICSAQKSGVLNQVYCCGANEYGQLGLGNNEDSFAGPQLNEFFSKSNINIVSIACGEYHSLFLSSDGILYSCGLNESNQLGYKIASEFQQHPKRVTSLKRQITQIACGRDHSYCLDIDGNVWAFGSNYRGQLGIKRDDTVTPQGANDEMMVHKIQWFENQNKKIEAISSGNYHGAAIDRTGCVYVWGRGDEGQIGNGKKGDRFIPTLVDGFNNVPIKSISCGCHHTVAVCADNIVYCWGNNRYNQCADAYVASFDAQHNFVRKAKQYFKLKPPKDDNDKQKESIQAVSAGSYHTLLVLNKPAS